MTADRLFWAAPLLIAAAPAGDGLSTGMLIYVITAIVGIVVLRGVLLRRHMRKRRGNARPVPPERPNDPDTPE